MLLLLFQIAGDCFELDADRVIEVVPLVGLRALPRAPAHVAGLMNYRGIATPMVDLAALLTGHGARNHMSTRIIVVPFKGPDGTDRPLGLMAERVTETRSFKQGDLLPAGVDVKDAPCLGEVVMDPRGGGMVQRVRVDALLPAEVRETLFKLAGNAENA